MIIFNKWIWARSELLAKNPSWIVNYQSMIVKTSIKTSWPACTATSSEDRWLVA